MLNITHNEKDKAVYTLSQNGCLVVNIAKIINIGMAKLIYLPPLIRKDEA